MSDTSDALDMHTKMELASSEEIWTPGEPVKSWTTDYDIRDESYIHDPVPIWAEMRARCPIAHTERLGGSWNPTSYEDVRQLASMVPDLSSRQPLVMPQGPNAPALSRYEQMISAAPITADPPIQTWTRRMLLPAFAPRAVARHQKYTEDLCHALIDGFINETHCDAAVDYAQQIPPRVIAHVIGVDAGMADQFVDWVNRMFGEGLTDPETRTVARE
jgi:cytochrome P450